MYDGVKMVEGQVYVGKKVDHKTKVRHSFWEKIKMQTYLQGKLATRHLKREIKKNSYVDWPADHQINGDSALEQRP